jgi:methylenetetrahydrofolate reductase (NADPH)
MLPPTQTPTQHSLRHLLLETDTFVTCVELVTTRGTIAERSGQKVLELARALADNPEIHGLSITDNPGGNAMIGTDVLGNDLASRGQEVVIHLSCKDFNRNGLQSRAWQLASEGFHNILALSGDYPIAGYEGVASPVFDIDSVALLEILSSMNRGLETVGRKGKTTRMKKTGFFLGAVVNNHKVLESEVMPQYFKLAKKIACGAEFIINQIGYDARKQDELLKYMAREELAVPVIGNVYVLNGAAARVFNASRIPGVVVSDALLDVAEKQSGSEDKGKAFFIELAAKQCAIHRGLGYRGVYMGGNLKYEDYERILELEKGFGADDWKQFAAQIQFGRPGEFYLFEADGESGLNTTDLNREYITSLTDRGRSQSRNRLGVGYKFNRAVHNLLFEKDALGFALARKLYGKLDESRFKGAAHSLEHAAKIAAFDCRDCGDCSLPDIAYLCPESQCVKNQRNGPCGGTRAGQCEIGEKECIWSRAYKRLKAYGEEEEMLNRPAVFKDGALKGTSAWANTFLQRDHHAKNEGTRVAHED